MKQYIMMKGYDRVNVKNTHNLMVISGDLTLIDSFEPVLYKRNILTRFKAYTHNLEMVRVHIKPSPLERLPKNVYAWLISECDGIVYKVWGKGTTYKVNNIVKDGYVMTTNGAYLPEDFKLFEF